MKQIYELDSDTRLYIFGVIKTALTVIYTAIPVNSRCGLGESVLAPVQFLKIIMRFQGENRLNEIEFCVLAEGKACWHPEQYLNRNHIFHSS